MSAKARSEAELAAQVSSVSDLLRQAEAASLCSSSRGASGGLRELQARGAGEADGAPSQGLAYGSSEFPMDRIHVGRFEVGELVSSR